MEAGKQTASMEAWEAIPAPEQVEIVTRAAKRGAYIAGAYGVVLTVNEIMGATWEGTIKRLDADRLCKANVNEDTVEAFRAALRENTDYIQELVYNRSGMQKVESRLTINRGHVNQIARHVGVKW